MYEICIEDGEDEDNLNVWVRVRENYFDVRIKVNNLFLGFGCLR